MNKYKHNINYFKRGDSFKTIGLGVTIVGLIVLYFGWSYISYVLSIIAIPVGLALFFIGSTGHSSDEDIDADIKSITTGLEVNLAEDKQYAKRILKHIEPKICEGYEYKDGLYFIKAKNGTIRSSEYTKAIIYVLSDELYIVKRNFSLVSDNVINQTFEIPYSDIISVEIIRETKSVECKKKKFNVNFAYIKVEYTEGQIFYAPIHDDVDSDKFIETINDVMKTADNSN